MKTGLIGRYQRSEDMIDEQKMWKITDFAKEISERSKSSIHYNTVDNWFKKLEEKKIHYINRIEETDEKCYNQEDLEIALFIKAKREENWSLNAIFQQIPDFFETRPFPQLSTNDSQILDKETLKREIRIEMQKAMEETAAAQIAEVKQQYEQLKNLLPQQRDIENAIQNSSKLLLEKVPKQKSPEEERQERLNDLFTQRRVESKLENEALEYWYQKPKEERMKKVWWFRIVEDYEAKDRFVRQYINQYFEVRMKDEYGL
ncbi:MerR family transcriptional regulator [Alkalihalobacillus deserti]|uniref:MerR family transcriptional regulator n=1 Tax=Alkalihalobacillus deserti TaxID=2879466 RepID=UPI001D14BB18|nr:MerR family transcriptional regulator [Alkalihalobacillus deserti]